MGTKLDRLRAEQTKESVKLFGQPVCLDYQYRAFVVSVDTGHHFIVRFVFDGSKLEEGTGTDHANAIHKARLAVDSYYRQQEAGPRCQND